jgi:hypothetical protein
MLGVAAAILAVAATNPVTTTPEATGPIGSALYLDPASDTPTTDPPAPSTTRPVVTLGDLDPPPTPTPAPFDPCTVIGWADLPAPVRPATASAPSRRSPGPGDEFTVGCRFDGAPGPDATGPSVGGWTTVTVTWGTTAPRSLDPSRYPNATTAVFGDRTGLQRVDSSPDGHPRCLGLMPAAGGVAAAEATTTRLSTTDACTVVDAALRAIANKTP